MTDGLSAVQARISQLRQLVDPAAMQPRSLPSSSASGTNGSSAEFGSALVQAMGGPATGATGATGGSLGKQAVSIAKQYLGVDYKWGGTNPKTGLDCSGLTQLVYKQLGVDLPRVSRDQAKVGTEVASLKDAKPGDLVFFDDPVDHVGIYAGNGKMVESPHTGAKVRVHDVWEKPSHIRRVLPDSIGTSSAASSTLNGINASASSGGVLTGPYAAQFTKAGRKYGVDPALLSAIAKAESSYNPRAQSGAGAQGLMQLMPGTARELGVDAMNPTQAIDGAARLIGKHLKSYGGRVDLALAAYNAGPGNVRKYGGVPPFQETQNYVQRVTRFYGDLR